MAAQLVLMLVLLMVDLNLQVLYLYQQPMQQVVEAVVAQEDFPEMVVVEATVVPAS